MDDRRKLHERIAESLSLKPTGKEWPPVKAPGWKWAGTVNGGFIAVNFDTDESANAMLLEAMPQPTLECVFINDPELPPESRWWLCFHDCDAAGVSSKDTDRKRAIVDAFAKWKGLL